MRLREGSGYPFHVIRALGAGPAGVFPFGFSGQAIDIALGQSADLLGLRAEAAGLRQATTTAPLTPERRPATSFQLSAPAYRQAGSAEKATHVRLWLTADR